ncbi:MAG: hypothetical protein IKQ15_05805 [Kiritimatiellae bacterium]|nr:hypothetical protein [Kiritimatiellia bacterium]
MKPESYTPRSGLSFPAASRRFSTTGRAEARPSRCALHGEGRASARPQWKWREGQWIEAPGFGKPCLSTFPDPERRRIAVDYVTSTPDAPPALLRLPEDIRRTVDATLRSIRRSRLRAAQGLCPQDASDAFCARATKVLDTWLAEKESTGALLPSERQAILATLP